MRSAANVLVRSCDTVLGPHDVADEAYLRDLLALCGVLGLEMVSLQQLPAAGGSVTVDGGGDPGRGV
jgi:hypothetical protein